MPWSSGIFSKIHAWLNDQANDIPILASRFDEQEGDIASGINQCRWLGGGSVNVPTADLEMNGFRHRVVGDPISRTDYISTKFAQDNAHRYSLTAGSNNAYTASISPAVTTLADGLMVAVRWHQDSGSTQINPLTLNVNNTGAFPIQFMRDGAVEPVEETGALQAGAASILIHISNVWYLIGYQDQVISTASEIFGVYTPTTPNRIDTEGGFIFFSPDFTGTTIQSQDYVLADLLNDRLYPVRPGNYRLWFMAACHPNQAGNVDGHLIMKINAGAAGPDDYNSRVYFKSDFGNPNIAQMFAQHKMEYVTSVSQAFIDNANGYFSVELLFDTWSMGANPEMFIGTARFGMEFLG